MPHLAELQKKYADKGVQLISISDEDLETVEKFLDREVRAPKARTEEGAEKKDAEKDDADKAAKPATYRELTSAYCLTTDPDQSSNKDYMEAAAQNGIPTAFIVGKDSKIEWIGHPMEMDQPLADVVADKWDRAAYLKVMKARQEAEKAMEQLSELVQNGKFDDAIKLLDDLIAKAPSDDLKLAKLQILLIAKKNDEATAWTEQLFKDLANKPEMVNMVSWTLYEMTEQGQLKSPAMVDLAIKASEAALAAAPAETKASAIDTIAHLYAIKGDKKKALELEEQAVKLATGQDLEFMQQFLEELKSENKSDKDK